MNSTGSVEIRSAGVLHFSGKAKSMSICERLKAGWQIDLFLNLQTDPAAKKAKVWGETLAQDPLRCMKNARTDPLGERSRMAGHSRGVHRFKGDIIIIV